MGKVYFRVTWKTLFWRVLGAWMTFKKTEMAKTSKNGLSMIETNPLNHNWSHFVILPGLTLHKFKKKTAVKLHTCGLWKNVIYYITCNSFPTLPIWFSFYEVAIEMLRLSDFTFCMLEQKYSEIVSIQNSNATLEKLWPHCVRSAIKNWIF